MVDVKVRTWIDRIYIPLSLLLNGSLFYLLFMHLIDVVPTTPTTGIFYGLLSVWILVAAFRSFRVRCWRPNSIDVSIGLFFLFLVFSLAFNDFDDRARMISYLPFFVVIPYIGARSCSRRQLEGLLHWTIGTGCLLYSVTSIWLVDSYLKGDNFGDRPKLFGYDHSALIAGMVIASIAILAVASLLHARGSRTPTRLHFTVMPALSLPLLYFVIQYLGARGGLFSSIITIAVAVLVASAVSLRRRTAVFAWVLLSIVGSFLVLPQTQLHFFSRLIPAIEITSEHESHVVRRNIVHGKDVCALLEKLQYHGKSGVVRRFLYLQAAVMFKHHPIAGVGAGKYGVALCDDSRYFPHSTVLQTFAELGVFGAGFFCFAILLTGIEFYRYVNESITSVAWPLAMLWVFYFINDQIYGNYFLSLPFFLLTGAASALFAADAPGAQVQTT